jgi:hypothetical protein
MGKGMPVADITGFTIREVAQIMAACEVEKQT